MVAGNGGRMVFLKLIRRWRRDLAQMSKSKLYMDARTPFHSRLVGQDAGRPRLDWIIDEGESPKLKIVVVVDVRTFPF